MIRNVKIGTRLLISFLAVGVIPCAIIGFFYHLESSNVISSQAFEKLKTVQEVKKAQVEEYFKMIGEEKSIDEIKAHCDGLKSLEVYNWLLSYLGNESPLMPILLK